jgi:hypothetical protein
MWSYRKAALLEYLFTLIKVAVYQALGWLCKRAGASLVSSDLEQRAGT